ncbi:unnamed protein product [Mycena citricolor]|uniref:Uncharacterized protein n=1 Tax=Mycena citricolor TaxID=2018698 RepID=A0AAD2Q6Q2_9AGAR|nr:unnamed protein product [Mycena citricolor]
MFFTVKFQLLLLSVSACFVVAAPVDQRQGPVGAQAAPTGQVFAREDGHVLGLAPTGALAARHPQASIIFADGQWESPIARADPPSVTTIFAASQWDGAAKDREQSFLDFRKHIDIRLEYSGLNQRGAAEDRAKDSPNGPVFFANAQWEEDEP